MDGPRIYLAIDNCFAAKRWTRPSEWARIARDLGLSYAEASADNECDPLYTTPDYLVDWLSEVRAAEDATGIRVANLYSGHGTYSTLGLAHTDPRVRDHLLNEWLKPMARNAGELGAGLGFYCHAFADAVLQSPADYGVAQEDLYARLAELAQYAHSQGVVTIGLEQMYTPHQIPWTIRGTQRLLGEVFARSKRPFYITIDTGHQVGQRRFLYPHEDQLRQALRACWPGEDLAGLWLGPRSAYALLRRAVQRPESEADAYLEQIREEIERFPYLFAASEDGDPYAWLERLACYSPIIHLQQTSGLSSSHLPFTRAHNEAGAIHPSKVLKCIGGSYMREEEEGLPPRCPSIYLTLEIFSGTADTPAQIIAALEESVAYWRQVVPRDGLKLADLLKEWPTCRSRAEGASTGSRAGAEMNTGV